MMCGRITAPSGPPPTELHTYIGLFAGREAVNRRDREGARAIANRLAGGGPVLEASQYSTLGLLDQHEDDWHHALHLASEHGLAMVAVDALEGLGIAAASADSSTEALRLFGAADRLRSATGYRWRFPVERDLYDRAVAAARGDLGDAADDAWTEGQELDLESATEYARRARGARARPRHGWDSLTPTELRVVELVAAGHSNPEIAERLLMSRSTVKTHLEHMYTKTGLHNRTELAAASARREHDVLSGDHQWPGG